MFLEKYKRFFIFGTRKYHSSKYKKFLFFGFSGFAIASQNINLIRVLIRFLYIRISSENLITKIMSFLSLGLESSVSLNIRKNSFFWKDIRTFFQSGLSQIALWFTTDIVWYAPVTMIIQNVYKTPIVLCYFVFLGFRYFSFFITFHESKVLSKNLARLLNCM